MYYLLSAFGRPMLEQQPAAGAAAVTAAGDALLVALQGQALVREAMASAAVALYAAAALPDAPPAALARCFAQGLLCSGGSGSAVVGQPTPMLLLPTEAEGSAAAMACGAGDIAVGLVDSHLRQRQAQPNSDSSRGSGRGSSSQGGLAGELRQLPPLNRICAIRGLLAAMPATVACAPLATRWSGQTGPAGQREEQPWLLLVDGALPAISAAIQASLGESPDSLCWRGIACGVALHEQRGCGRACTGLAWGIGLTLEHQPLPAGPSRAPPMNTSSSTGFPHWQCAWSASGTSSSRRLGRRLIPLQVWQRQQAAALSSPHSRRMHSGQARRRGGHPRCRC